MLFFAQEEIGAQIVPIHVHARTVDVVSRTLGNVSVRQAGPASTVKTNAHKANLAPTVPKNALAQWDNDAIMYQANVYLAHPALMVQNVPKNATVPKMAQHYACIPLANVFASQISTVKRVSSNVLLAMSMKFVM